MVDDLLDLSRIRQAVRDRRVFWTAHAKRRLFSRQIARREVFEIIEHGEIIERGEQSQPYPKCLFLGFVRDQQPLYASIAFDGTHVIIITVHWFDPEKWIDPRTRR